MHPLWLLSESMQSQYQLRHLRPSQSKRQTAATLASTQYYFVDIKKNSAKGIAITDDKRVTSCFRTCTEKTLPLIDWTVIAKSIVTGLYDGVGWLEDETGE